MALTREQLLGAQPASEEVTCPELGGAVRVREMLLAEREAFELGASEADGDGRRITKIDGFRARLIIATVVGDDGAALFTSEDFELVQRLPADLSDRLARTAIRLNGLERDAVEDAAKN